MDEKMKLMADVIDLAINKYLWDGQRNRTRPTLICSCSAIYAADNYESDAEKIMAFLEPMGVDSFATQEFNCAHSGQKRQYARALWLTWAAIIAREEGKTI